MPERTTVEISAKHKLKLISTAAKRGLKGFSKIIDEALTLYFLEDGIRSKKLKAALDLQGSFSDTEADQLAAKVAEAREKWRS